MMDTNRRSHLLGIFLIGLAALVPAPGGAGEVVFGESCFPTCDVTDGRFLIIAGGESLETLADEPLRLKFSVDKNQLGPGNTFSFEIFDGDSNGCTTPGPCDPRLFIGDPHWDVGLQVEVTYRLIAIRNAESGAVFETDVSPSKIVADGGPGTNPLSSTVMHDNGWYGVTVEVGPEAQAFHSGNYFYALEIERDPGFVFLPGEGLLNALKVRTDASVFLSLLEQPFAFEAKWTSAFDDLPIVYPHFDLADPFNPAGLANSRYDGSFIFHLKIPPPAPGETRTGLRILDGDLDHGKWDGSVKDTDDPDTDYPVPCIPGDPACTLPFELGSGARAEGVAFAPFPGVTGAPADDALPLGARIFNLRPPSVHYRIDFPVNTDPGTIACRPGESEPGPIVDGRVSIRNLNPSGNREWEKFTLSTDPFDADLMDCHVDSIPAGVYRIELEGMDMNNLNAWYFGEDVCGVQPDSDPLCPVGEFLVGDTVWEDTDGDGNGDPAEIAADGESGIAGVILDLLDADGTRIGRTLTDADGLYEFSVGPGEYTVVVAPENFSASTPLGEVGDFVWLDVDRDGLQDPGEAGIANVVVQLYDAGGDGAVGGGDDILLESAVTDLDGKYLFANLPAGSYYTAVVDSTLPSGLTLTSAAGNTDPSAVGLIVGDNSVLTLDFGYSNSVPGTALVGDFVWHDLDQDGLQDPGEAGIGGVTVRLLDRSGPTPVPVATLITEGGNYLFTNVPPGDYEVDVTDALGALAGYSLTTGNDPTGVFTLLAGTGQLDKDFGYFQAGLYTISDDVWYDADRDGLFDAGEGGIVGVTVSLFGADGSVVASATTAVDGSFSFAGLAPGSYALVITDLGAALDGLVATTPGALIGSAGATIVDASIDAESFGYVAGGALQGLLATTASPTQSDEVVDENVLTYDFGYRPGSIGDTVFVDNDKDGLYEPALGERGVPGVLVELYNGAGTLVATTTTVGGDGFYLFGSLSGGDYQVVIPAGNFAPGGALFGYFQVSDPDGLLDNRTAHALAAGEDYRDADFGYLRANPPGTGTPGYWKNHPEDWPVDEITLGGVTYSKAEAIFILDQSRKSSRRGGDKTYTLGAALISAKLNALSGNDTSCISDVMAAADSWFGAHPPGSGVRGSSQAWKQAEPWYFAIDDYNNGLLCAPARD